MPRSEEREQRKLKYASAREAAQRLEMGGQANYLKVPSGVTLWKPKKGIYLIDILPYVAGKNNPQANEGYLWWEYSFHVHRGIGSNTQSFICPAKTFGKKCPICEERDRLQRNGDEGDEKLVKSMAPRGRQIMNLRDLKEPDKGIQLYETANFNFGDQLLQDIGASDPEEGWDQFFSLDEGCTLRVSMIEDSFAGRTFIKAGRFDFKPRSKPIKQSVLDEVHDLESLIKVLSYDELKEKFHAMSEEEEPEESDEESEEEEGDEADNHRPKGKKRRDEEEPEDENDPDEGDYKRGKRSSREEEPEEDEEPRSRRSRSDEPEEEDEEPKRSKRSSREEEPEEDEEPKSKRRSRDEDEDDEPPKRGKRDREEDVEEDEPKGKRSRSEEDEDWDDFEKNKERQERRRSRDEESEEEEPKEDEEEDQPKRSKKPVRR